MAYFIVTSQNFLETLNDILDTSTSETSDQSCGFSHIVKVTSFRRLNLRYILMTRQVIRNWAGTC
jgi:Mn-dependent DtxR family transcriptional regulator